MASCGGKKNGVCQVFGADLCLPAIEDAKVNAEANGLKNCEFVCGKVGGQFVCVVFVSGCGVCRLLQFFCGGYASFFLHFHAAKPAHTSCGRWRVAIIVL